MSKHRLLFILAMSMLFANWATGLQTTLTWIVGKDSITFKELVTASGKGFSATISSSVGEFDSLLLDANRSTLEWRRSVPGERTEIVATRNGGQLLVKGTYKGKPYDAKVDVGELPWYQFQEISYERFFESGESSASFWTMDRKTLKPSLFKAEKVERVSIPIMDNLVKSIKYDLTIGGVPSFLFKAHFWIRESDGRFLKLEVPPILNLPRSVVELRHES